MKKLVMWLLAMLFAQIAVEGRHIIGGDLSYECMGEGRYRFTMKIYRDCSNPNGDYFDFNAPIAVYLGNEEPYEFITKIYTPLELPITGVPPDDTNPCLILPSNICVEQGAYFFELDLPISEETYHIIYQRCCRNNTINNILEPYRSGATYSITLTPEAQQFCNNSPVFNDFPPIVICAGEPLAFDHSASDEDGDQLVYELCSPLLGAGVVGFLEPGDPASCDGFRPDPPCPPPYEPVSFISPHYSALAPLGGDPVVTINPNTGLITGTPVTQGQFVVGICVYEFRDGVLLSTTRRDFQFNVANCSPTVAAKIAADSVSADNIFIINACQNEVSFVNESFQQGFIEEHYWQFNIDGHEVVAETWNLTHAFPRPGHYEGQLVLNPNTECGDTALIHVNVFPGIAADFTFEYDTCIAGPVDFTDLSTAANGIKDWEWSFGDGQRSVFQNPNHEYADPGIWEVDLQVTDWDGCKDQMGMDIDYFPAPAVIVVAPDQFIGCSPASISFNNLSTPIDESYDIQWSFGDGAESTEISPTHIYQTDGLFDVQIAVTSPIGCKVDTLFEDWIEIQPSPIASFYWEPEEISNFENEVQLIDASEGGVSWLWLEQDTPFSARQNPSITLLDTGLTSITLIVTHPEGCRDTITQALDVKPEVRIFFPNAFTPNGDGRNDIFKPVGVLNGISDFQFQVWNRWGELIFQSSDPNDGWRGEQSPGGVYFYNAVFKGPRGESYILEGMATLVK